MLIGTGAMTVALAGCSMSPEPSVSTAAPTPSAKATVAAPDLPDAPETSSPTPTISWVEIGYGGEDSSRRPW